VAAYASVRAGLHALLAGVDDFAVVGEVGNSVELERVLPDVQPDVVIYDLSDADRERIIEVVSGSEAGLVVLGEERVGYRSLVGSSLSGWAYLLKENAETTEIAGVVRGVEAGLIVLDRSLSFMLHHTNETLYTQQDRDDGEPLTARELEVLQLMAQGLSNRLIAERLFISLHTVKFHVASILAKLGASSRTEAVTLGARRGDVIF
jgi:NarL family two-component system response regulator YdfI